MTACGDAFEIAHIVGAKQPPNTQACGPARSCQTNIRREAGGRIRSAWGIETVLHADSVGVALRTWG